MPDSELHSIETNRSGRTVFTKEQENALMQYLLTSSVMFYGYAQRLNMNLPGWEINKEAGVEWFRSFMSRHPQLTIRRPQATSLHRAASFNRTNVSRFFNNLQTVLNRNQFESRNIWNMDETGITTVHKPNRVVR